MKIDVRGIVEGLAAVQLGDILGDIQVHHERRQQEQQTFNNSLQAAEIMERMRRDDERRQDEFDDSLLRSLPNVKDPAEQQRIYGDVMGRRAKRASTPAPNPFQGVQIPNRPEYAPFRSAQGQQRQAGPAPFVPQSYRVPNPEIEQQYETPLAERKKRLAASQDPQEIATLSREIAALEGNRTSGKPVGETVVQAGGFAYPLGAAGMERLPVSGADRTRRTQVTKDVSGSLKDIDGLVADLPADSADRLEWQKLKGIAPRSFQTDADLDAADRWWYQAQSLRSRLQSLRSRNSDESRRAAAEAAYYKRLQELPDLDPAAQAAALPELLDLEAELQKQGGKLNTVSTRLGSQKEDIEEVRRLLKDGLRDDAAKVARGVAGRIARRLTPQQEQAALRGLFAYVARLSPEQASDPQTIQQLAENFGIPHLVEGLEGGAFGLGGAAAEKAYREMLGKLPNVAKLSPEAQRPFLDSLIGYARAAGKTVDIPAELVVSLSPTERQKLALDRARLALRGDRLSIDRARLSLDRAGVALAKSRLGAAGGGSKAQKSFLENLKRQADNAHKTWTAFLGSAEVKQDQSFKLPGDPGWAQFDPVKARADINAGKNTNPLHLRAVQLWEAWDHAERELTAAAERAAGNPASDVPAGGTLPQQGQSLPGRAIVFSTQAAAVEAVLREGGIDPKTASAQQRQVAANIVARKAQAGKITVQGR